MRLQLLAVLLVLLVTGGTATARQLTRTTFHSVDYVSLTDLAAGLGTVPTRLGGSVVLRTGFGILTLFEESADFVWRPAGAGLPTEGRLSVPPVEAEGTLWVPLELLYELGATVSGIVVVLPDRTRLLLTDMGALAGPPAAVAVQSDPQSPAGSELVELGNGVSALRFRAGTQSVLITDLGLLALVQPGERSRFDEFMQELSGYRPLYFVLSAAEQGETSLEFTVRQGSMSRKLTEGDGVVLLSGDPATVAPGKPVSGVLLLPGTTNLRAPLQLQWQHLSAGMIFRR